MEFLPMVVLLLASQLSAQSTPVLLKEITTAPAPSTGFVSMKSTDNPSSSFQTQSPTLNPSDGENRSLVEAFLYNGNETLLLLANCSKAYQLPALQRPASEFSLFLRPAVAALTNAANFLNMIFQANDLRESSIKEDLEWYHALVRGLLESDPLIRRTLLSFDTQPAALRPQLVLQAKRPSYKSQDILLQDLSSAWEDLHPSPSAPDASWYTDLKFSTQTAPTLSKRILLNDLNTLDTPKWERGDSYVTNRNEVRWASAPFLECDNGQFLPEWLLTLSTSFYGLKPDLSPEFRGVVRIDVSLQSFDVDQCAQGKDWFSNTHRCNRTTMHCKPIHGRGFRLGQYTCLCKEGYYSPSQDIQKARVGENSSGSPSEMFSPTVPVCLPCWPACRRCKDGATCKVQGNWYLRLGVLAVQSFSMLLVFICMFMAYRFRQNKRIRASGLLLLETILFGSLLLYFPVFILYFKPSTFRCILLRWVRLMGFAIVYGTITLKMYRVLRVFLPRTAQWVPYMSSTHVLRLLGVIVLMVIWFLSAWTANALQNRDRNIPLLITSTTQDGRNFSLCDVDRWDYMMPIAELLFLCWGSSLRSSVRLIPSAFHEPRYMGISIHNELMLSSAFNIIRFAMPLLHPDWMLLLFFTHTHVTITVTLGLLFIPKFLNVSRPLHKEIAVEVYEDEMDMQRSCPYFNSSLASAWNEHNMDSDDIRDELKKLYEQLEVHKTKKMSANNPHLPKKRSSHLGLGQSIIKRIAKFPESMSRRCSREEVSLYSGGGSKPASCKRKVLESGSIRSSEESFKQGVLFHRKSHSIYDHSQDHQIRTGDIKDASQRQSFVRGKLAKKASESSEIRSIDAVPFVYKSASAHNLSANNQLLQPMPKKLQKSLSVMTSNRDGSTLHPSNMYNGDDANHASKASPKKIHPIVSLTISSQTINAHEFDSLDKAEACHWDHGDCFPENKSSKHVTYAFDTRKSQKPPGRTESHFTQHKNHREPLPRDCPQDSLMWTREHVMNNDQKNCEALHEKIEGPDSDSEPAKPQLSVSCSAPHSPITVLVHPKELRVLSLRGTSSNSMKGSMSISNCSAKDKDKKENQEEKGTKVEMLVSKYEESVGFSRTASLTNFMTENVGIVRTDSNRMCNPVSDDLQLCTQQKNGANIFSRTLQEQMVTEIINIKESMQAGISNLTRRQESIYENICPWETVNLEMVKRQISLRANICPWEMEEDADFKDSKYIREGQRSPVNLATDKSAHQNMPSQTFLKTDVCPWEVSEGLQQTLERQQSIWADICPWEVENISSSSINFSSSKHLSGGLNEVKNIQKKDKILTDVCPWEEEDLENSTESQTSDQKINEIQEKMHIQHRLKKESINIAVTCTNISINENRLAETTVKAEVCPWDIISQQALQGSSSGIADVCPWDVPDPHTKTQESACTDIHPWEMSRNETSSLRLKTGQAEICPWEKKEDGSESNQKIDKAEVCPWDVLVSLKQTIQRNEDNVEKICPWENQEYETESNQKIDKAEVCPWDVPLSLKQTLERNEGSVAEISPWEMTDPNSAYTKTHALESFTDGIKQTEKKTQHNVVNVCIRENENTDKTIRLQHKINESITQNRKEEIENLEEAYPQHIPELNVNMVNIYSWESISTKPYLVKQTAIQTCSEEPETLQTRKETDNKSVIIHSSLKDIKNPGSMCSDIREDNVCSSICPWDTEDLESTSKKQDGSCADICPWEITATVDNQRSTACMVSTVKVTVTGPPDENEESQKHTVSNEQKLEGAQEVIPLGIHDATYPRGVQEVKHPILGNEVTYPDIPLREDKEVCVDAEIEAEAFCFPLDL